MALNFPSDPELNEKYPVNGIVYIWDGTKWTAKSDSSSTPPITPDADGNVVITGTLTVNGATITGSAMTLSGDLSAANISGSDGTFTGDITAANGDLSGNLNVAGDIDND